MKGTSLGRLIPYGSGSNMDSYVFVNQLIHLKWICAISGGAFFFYVGVLHFTDTKWFEPIVPSVIGYAKTSNAKRVGASAFLSKSIIIVDPDKKA